MPNIDVPLEEEFTITTKDGEKVKVKFGPGYIGTSHFEFHGPITHTGYYSDFCRNWKQHFSKPQDYAKAKADALEEEMHKRDEKARKYKKLKEFKKGDRILVVGKSVITEPKELNGSEGIVAGFEPPYEVAVQIEGQKYLRYYWEDAVEIIKESYGQQSLLFT